MLPFTFPFVLKTNGCRPFGDDDGATSTTQSLRSINEVLRSRLDGDGDTGREECLCVENGSFWGSNAAMLGGESGVV